MYSCTGCLVSDLIGVWMTFLKRWIILPFAFHTVNKQRTMFGDHASLSYLGACSSFQLKIFPE